MSHSGGSLYKGESREGEARKKWTTIIISTDVRRELEALRVEFGARSFNDVIRRLINERREATSRRIKAIMCNDMNEVSASYVGWVRLLINKGLKPSEILVALEFLNGSINELRVDNEKCKE